MQVLYLLDGQGSVVGLTNASGNVVNTYAYDDWGNTTSTTGTAVNFYGYKSSMAIGTLHKFGTRWYNTQTGTFTQPDPQPAANAYTYADNDPINNSDSSGQNWVPDVVTKSIPNYFSNATTPHFITLDQVWQTALCLGSYWYADGGPSLVIVYVGCASVTAGV